MAPAVMAPASECTGSGESYDGDANHVCPVLDTDARVQGMNKYLVYFVHRHTEYRLAEVEALAGAAGVPIRAGPAQPHPTLAWSRPHGDNPESPLWYIHLPSDDAAKSISKQVLMAKVGQQLLLGEGVEGGGRHDDWTHSELHA